MENIRKKVKVTVYWEDEFIVRAKAFAKSKGISLSQLVEECIAEDIEKNQRRRE